MQVLRQLTTIQWAIAMATLGLAFAVGVLVGDAANSGIPGILARPLGDFVVTVIASLVVAIVLVSAGAGLAKLGAKLRHG